MEGMLMLLVMMVIAMVLAWMLDGKQRKQAVSLLLCAAMMSSYIPVINVAKADSAAKPVLVNEQVLVNGTKTTQIGAVTYSSSGSAYTLDTSSARVRVKNGDSISFDGAISAPEGETISWVRVDVYDANTEEPYTVGAEYYRADGLKVQQYDLSNIPALTIGEAFGSKDYALAEGGKYIVMFCVGDSNGNAFVDMDADIEEDQGPAILVDVKLSPSNCKHPHSDYVYILHSSGEVRKQSYGDSMTHQVEPLYERYCGLCDTFLMNIWGEGTPEEHTMANGVCMDCGYAAVPMMMNTTRNIPSIQFISPDDRSEYDVGEVIPVKWKAVEGTDEYVVYVKILDGEPVEGSDDEAGTLIASEQNWTQTEYEFTLFSVAAGKWVKINVHGKNADGIQTEAASTLYVYYRPESTDPSLCGHYHQTAKYTTEYYPIESDDEFHEKRQNCAWYCNNCGILVSETDLEPVQEAHEFYSDGRCSICRYKKELDCYHTYSNREWLSTDYEKKDDTYHNVVNAYRVTCRDCGELIYNYMPEYLPEKHVFNDTDTCMVCGWSKGDACLHWNEEYIPIGNKDYSLDYLDEYEPLYHRVESECVLKCKDCGEVLLEDVVNSELELHSFDSNNQCSACGYIGEDLIVDDTAPVIISFTSSVGTTVSVGQMPTYEAIVYDENLRYVELSADDGWTLDEVIEPVSDTVDVSAWSYAGEVGTYTYKVTAIDYAGNVTERELVITVVADEFDCQHTNYTDHYNRDYPIEYGQKDDTSHYYRLGYDRICDDCGYSWVVYSEPPLTDVHTFEDWVCSLCGYVDTTDREPPEIPLVNIDISHVEVTARVVYSAEIHDNVELSNYMLYLNDRLLDSGTLSGMEDVVEYTTDGLLDGEYYFKLVVYDAAGNESIRISEPIKIGENVEESPVINSIKVNGTEETTFAAGTELTFFTVVGDETALSKIELFIDGELKKTETVSGLSGTISYTTSALAIGEHTVMVVATDASGLTNDVSLTVTVQKAECPHSNVTWKEETAFEQLSENTAEYHTHHVVVVTKHAYCNDCDLTEPLDTLHPDLYPPQEVSRNNELHQFIDGVCSDCHYEMDFVPECEHLNKVIDESSIVVENQTEEEHTVSYWYFCNDCKMLLNSVAREERTEAHTFDEKDVCTTCGYTENPQNLPTMTFTVDKFVVNAGEEVEFTFTMTGSSLMANKVMMYAEDKYILTVGQNEAFTFDSNPEIGVFKWKYKFNQAGVRKIQFVPVYEGAYGDYGVTAYIEGLMTPAQKIEIKAYLNLYANGWETDLSSRSINASVHNYGGDGTPIDVDSNMNWMASTDAEWITLTADKKKNQILHHYEPNTDGYERTATITVSAPSCEDWTIFVTQSIIPLSWAGKVGGDYNRYVLVDLTQGTLNPYYTYELQVYDEEGTLLKTKLVTANNQFDYYKDLGMLRGKRYRTTVKESDHEGNLVKEYPSGIVIFDYYCSIDEVRSGKSNVAYGEAIYSGEDISIDWTGSSGYDADIDITIGNTVLHDRLNNSGGTYIIKADEYKKYLTSERTDFKIVLDVEGKKAEREHVIIQTDGNEKPMIHTPDNGEMIRLFDDEDIVVTWSPYHGTEYYKVFVGLSGAQEWLKTVRVEANELLEVTFTKEDLIDLLPDNAEQMMNELVVTVRAYID